MKDTKKIDLSQVKVKPVQPMIAGSAFTGKRTRCK